MTLWDALDGDNVERTREFDPYAILAPVAIHQAAHGAASKADARVALAIISTITDSPEETEAYASLLRARVNHLIATPRAKSAILTIADEPIDTGYVSGPTAAHTVAETFNCDERRLRKPCATVRTSRTPRTSTR